MSVTMKKYRVGTMLAAASALAISGCQTTNTGIGAAAGGLLGGGICALAGGNRAQCLAIAAVSAVAGGVIGNELDKRDRERRDAAFKEATVKDEPIYWENDETSNSGSIQTLNSYQDSQGRECNVYEETYVKDGRTIADEYTVCTGADGEPVFL